ncbi:MAG: DUF2892 domain-containing protein [Anaerolineales bacterium]|nr:DUF2892 domain-containing protein [Anaerolineales bacterium]
MSAIFKANESNVDRIIRVVLGAVLVGLNIGGVVTGTWGWVLLVAGAVLLLTGLAGWCALYRLFGFSTK